jgi:hypothetical protein
VYWNPLAKTDRKNREGSLLERRQVLSYIHCFVDLSNGKLACTLTNILHIDGMTDDYEPMKAEKLIQLWKSLWWHWQVVIDIISCVRSEAWCASTCWVRNRAFWFLDSHCCSCCTLSQVSSNHSNWASMNWWRRAATE